MTTIREEYLNNLTEDFKAMSDILLTQFDLVSRQMKGENAEKLIQQIKINEHAIDLYEVRFREEITNDIVRQSPRASDLRRMIALLNIIIDVERVGDLLNGISKRLVDLGKQVDIFDHFKNDTIQLFEMVQKMVENATFAFLSENGYIAKSIIKSDDDVDAFYYEVHSRLFSGKGLNVSAENLSAYLSISRILYLLERIGDSATNIAEDIIYLTDGINMKHVE